MTFSNRKELTLTIPVLFLVTMLVSSLQAQQNEATTPANAESTKRADCRSDHYCDEEEAYIVVLTDVLESLTPGNRQVRLILNFENLSEHPIILAYRAHSIFVLDHLKNRYFCCKSESAADSSAMGIGTDDGNKTDSQFLLKPHQKRLASFDVWTYKSNPEASYYDVSVQIDEIDPTDRTTIRNNPFLTFRNVVPRARRSQHELSDKDSGQ